MRGCVSSVELKHCDMRDLMAENFSQAGVVGVLEVSAKSDAAGRWTAPTERFAQTGAEGDGDVAGKVRKAPTGGPARNQRLKPPFNSHSTASPAIAPVRNWMNFWSLGASAMQSSSRSLTHASAECSRGCGSPSISTGRNSITK
jgi:hypothetical protein